MSGKGQYQQEKEKNPKLYERAISEIDTFLSQKSFIGRFSKVKKRHIKFEQEKQAVLKLICKSEATAKAAMANPQSVADAMIDAARIGITLYPTLGYAYLVPESFADRPSIQLVIGYKGLEQLALKSKTVKQITTELVHANDTFRRGMNKDGSTWVEFEMARGDRGKLEGGYCRALLANGTQHVEWMSVNEIDGCEAAATAKQRGKKPASWSGAFRPEMQKKCVVRRASKHWVIDDDFAGVLETLDRLDPMDFDARQEKDDAPAEEVLVLTGEHKAEIVKQLADRNVDADKANGWIEKQCEAFGYKDGSANCPDSRWEEVRDKLIARADNIAKLLAEQQKKDEGEVAE